MFNITISLKIMEKEPDNISFFYDWDDSWMMQQLPLVYSKYFMWVQCVYC